MCALSVHYIPYTMPIIVCIGYPPLQSIPTFSYNQFKTSLWCIILSISDILIGILPYKIHHSQQPMSEMLHNTTKEFI